MADRPTMARRGGAVQRSHDPAKLVATEDRFEVVRSLLHGHVAATHRESSSARRRKLLGSRRSRARDFVEEMIFAHRLARLQARHRACLAPRDRALQARRLGRRRGGRRFLLPSTGWDPARPTSALAFDAAAPILVHSRPTSSPGGAARTDPPIQPIQRESLLVLGVKRRVRPSCGALRREAPKWCCRVGGAEGRGATRTPSWRARRSRPGSGLPCASRTTSGGRTGPSRSRSGRPRTCRSPAS